MVHWTFLVSWILVAARAITFASAKSESPLSCEVEERDDNRGSSSILQADSSKQTENRVEFSSNSIAKSIVRAHEKPEVLHFEAKPHCSKGGQIKQKHIPSEEVDGIPPFNGCGPDRVEKVIKHFLRKYVPLESLREWDYRELTKTFFQERATKCCDQHDLEYNTCSMSQKEADLNAKACWKKTRGGDEFAEVMYQLVKEFGLSDKQEAVGRYCECGMPEETAPAPTPGPTQQTQAKKVCVSNEGDFEMQFRLKSGKKKTGKKDVKKGGKRCVAVKNLDINEGELFDVKVWVTGGSPDKDVVATMAYKDSAENFQPTCRGTQELWSCS